MKVSPHFISFLKLVQPATSKVQNFVLDAEPVNF